MDPQSHRSRSTVRTPVARTPSRRSTTNLNNLTLHPLTTTSSHLPSSPDDDTSSHTTGLHSSYIFNRSAPSTPGILSKPSLSYNREYGNLYSEPHGFSKSYAYLGELHDSARMSMTGEGEGEGEGAGRSKSSAALSLLPPHAHGQRQRRKRNRSSKGKGEGYKEEDWFYRAGAAISMQNLESKGQSWLISRQSSTDLAGNTVSSPVRTREDQREFVGVYVRADVNAEDGMGGCVNVKTGGSTWGSRYGSRAQSRVVSARPSRRGSVVGSKLEMSAMAVGDVARSGSGYFGVGVADERERMGDVGREPDFVDGHAEQEEEDGEDESSDEEEVKDLAQKSGFGLGGVVDRLVGWSLFERMEEGEGSGVEEIGDEEREKVGDDSISTAKEVQNEKVTPKEEGRRKRDEDDRVLPAVRSQQTSIGEGEAVENGEDEDEDDEQGGWKDAAWLLSVASKVLF